MKKNLFEIILRLMIAVILFPAAFAAFNYIDVKEKGEPVAEMSNPSYPVMEVVSDGVAYNPMMGYRGNIDLSLVRSQIALTDQSGKIGIVLHHYDYDITAIHYTLFKRDPDDPLEEGTLNRLKKESDSVRSADLAFDTEIRSGRSYYLRLSVRLDNSTVIYYYTRLMNGSGRHFADYTEFALKFHDDLFDESTIETNAVYLEPSENVRESSMEHVDIHSSLSAVYFGSARMQEQGEPRIRIREVNDTYMVLQLSTIISSDLKQEYDMTEYYKLRYTASRMFLLDYGRTIDAYYEETLIDEKESMIGLGIQDMDRVQYKSSGDGRKVCFTQQGELWYYDYQHSNVTNVYSFVPELITDYHNDNTTHDIKILNMDEKGNITYLAYGYINRGHREGQNGMLIMKYSASKNSSEEMTFLETSMPFEEMKKDVKRFACLTGENMFYCCLGGALYEIDLTEKTFKEVMTGLTEDMFTASAEQNLVAIQTEKDLKKSKEITLRNLDTGYSRTITADTGKRICSIGFLREDYIYGEADEENLEIRSDGSIRFPISVIHIVNAKGKEVKTYKKANRYFLNTVIEGNVLKMDLARRRKNGLIRSTGKEDYIRYKEEEKKDEASLVYKYSSTYWNQLYFRFPEYVYIQISPDVSVARITTREDSPLMTLSDSGTGSSVRYYVYASGEEKETFETLAQAIESAAGYRGQVVDSSERTLWECTFPEYMKVPGMDYVTKVKNDKRSLAGCLSMIARLNGRDIPADKIDTRAGNPASLLEEYSGHEVLTLSGCTTDEILYYVSRGTPVLARYSGSRFVIVMSYNSTNIRYLDPVTGLSTSVDRTELTDRFEKAGNIFYTYIED